MSDLFPRPIQIPVAIDHGVAMVLDRETIIADSWIHVMVFDESRWFNGQLVKMVANWDCV
jgi:hypothetical protein